MTVTKRKSPAKRKPQRNTLYLPTEVRDEVERISVEVSYRRGSGFRILVSCNILLRHTLNKPSKNSFREPIQATMNEFSFSLPG